jgi:hypothetical protein
MLPLLVHGDEIPRRHTCEGEAVSPSLLWSDPRSLGSQAEWRDRWDSAMS